MTFAFLIDVIVIIIFAILVLSYRGDTQATGCGGTLTFRGPSGTITSPNYPNSYPSSLNCSYNIELSQQNSVNITFTDFATESCCDWLQVYCSVGSFRSSQRYSGQNSPPFFSIGSCSRVTIRFSTDGSTGERGFSLRYNIGDGMPVGLSLKPTNAFVRSANGNVILGCTSSIKRPDTYPCWFFSQDGLTFKQITTSTCGVLASDSAKFYRSTPKYPGGCNLTVLTTFLSSVTGLYTCTDSTLDSASAVVMSLPVPTLTSAPDLNLSTTEVVQGDSFTVACSSAAAQQQPRFAQVLLRLFSTEFNISSSNSINSVVTARPTILPGCGCEILVAGLPDGCDDSQPNGLSVSFPDRQVSFWPDAQNMTITGASDGKAKTNTALVCYAPSYPPSTYHWTSSVVSDTRTEGSVVIVTHSGTYTCTAECVIRGRTRQASKSIDITIDDSSESNVALIVGVILGAAVFVLIVILIVTCVCLFRKIRESTPASKHSDTTTTTTPNLTMTTTTTPNQTPQGYRPGVVNGQGTVNPGNSYTAGRGALELAGYDNIGFITENYERLQRPPRYYQPRN